MTDYCAFNKNHKCIKWSDYELTRHELEEADELCHGNWIEIQHLRNYIDPSGVTYITWNRDST